MHGNEESPGAVLCAAPDGPALAGSRLTLASACGQHPCASPSCGTAGSAAGPGLDVESKVLAGPLSGSIPTSGVVRGRMNNGKLCRSSRLIDRRCLSRHGRLGSVFETGIPWSVSERDACAEASLRSQIFDGDYGFQPVALLASLPETLAPIIVNCIYSAVPTQCIEHLSRLRPHGGVMPGSCQNRLGSALSLDPDHPFASFHRIITPSHAFGEFGGQTSNFISADLRRKNSPAPSHYIQRSGPSKNFADRPFLRRAIQIMTHFDSVLAAANFVLVL